MFSLARGTNISHWLSQSKARGQERRGFFTREDVQRIRDWGLDHIRIPIDEEQLSESGAVGEQRRDAEAFELLDSALDWCDAAGLKVVVDLHILRSHYFLDQSPPLFTEPSEAERFAWLWQDLSDAMRERSVEKVAFELMNEPVAVDDADWNRVLRYPLRAIRSVQPDRTVIIGSNRWNHCATFASLEVPEDPNFILTFHYYLPMLITHYRATWAKQVGFYRGRIQYPGRPIPDADWAALDEATRAALEGKNAHHDRAAMERDLAAPLGVAKRTGHRLYCGEFGVFQAVPDFIRIPWYRDIRSVLAQHDIAWANWDYKGAFGLIDANGRETAAYVGLLGDA